MLLVIHWPIIGNIIAVVAVLLINMESFQATNIDPNINLQYHIYIVSRYTVTYSAACNLQS